MSDANLIQHARMSMAKIGQWSTTFAFVSGIVSDVLNPLGPFAGYVAIIYFVGAILVIIAMMLRKLAIERGVPALAFLVISCIVAGGIYTLQRTQKAENGILAGLVPMVATLQQNLGIISQKIDVMDRKVTENLAVTKDVQRSADVIKAQNTQIALAVGQLAAGFKQLANLGGIVAQPERPDQFYHNARIHELSGDVLNAKRSYVGFATFNVDAVDPYARFATLLKVSEGRAGAREVLSVLRKTNKTPSLELAYVQLAEDANRLAKLSEFIAMHPDFGPAYYALADEFSEDRLGIRALSDKMSEADALGKFLAFEKDGKLIPYFVDQGILAEWTDRARSRLAALGQLNAVAQPKLNAMRSSLGWQMEVVLAEPASAIFWRQSQDEGFTDTGKLPQTDAATGQPKANPFFTLPADAKSANVVVKYVDVRGRDVGPFEIKFEPGAALISSQKSMIEQTSTGWIAFHGSGPKRKAFFTALASFSCAIQEVRYGYDEAPPATPFAMPACDPVRPTGIPQGYMTFVEMGDAVKSISVEVTYVDGTTSGVKRFNAP
jgi:hypothetical protein